MSSNRKRMFGIIYPDKKTELNWSPEADKYVGQLIPEELILPSIMDEDWSVIVDKQPDDGDDLDWLPDGAPIHHSCLVEVFTCGCDTRVLVYAGCRCGGFQNEQAFYRAFKKLMTKK